MIVSYKKLNRKFLIELTTIDFGGEYDFAI